MCYHSYLNRYIIKLAGAMLMQGVQQCVIHHSNSEVVSIIIVCEER